MNRKQKLLLIIISGFLVLLCILWLCLALYVQFNRQHMLQTITDRINKSINGKIEVAHIDLTLLKDFPGISAELEQVILYDSLWEQHGHELLYAEHIYLSFNVLSMMKGILEIKEVTVEDAKVYLFTDSTGYSNTSIFKQDRKRSPGGKPEIGNITLHNTEFVFENQSKFKFFRIHTDRLKGKMRYTEHGWTGRMNIRSLIRDFTFNTEKGSFVKNKRLRADIQIGYNERKQELIVPVQQIFLDNDPLQFGATFYFERKPTVFSLVITSNHILYQDALALLSPNISSKLQVVNLLKPVALNASIIGKVKFRDTPLVRVNWHVKQNEFVTPAGNIKECSFIGNFTNRFDTALGFDDRNAMIRLDSFEGKWYDIPFRADSVRIHNLIDPGIQACISADFPLEKLNTITGGNNFSFTGGHAAIQLRYQGGLKISDTTPPKLDGHVRVKGLGMQYLPRDLAFHNSDITLLFDGDHITVRDGVLCSRMNTLQVEGSVHRLLNLYYTAPERVIFNWNIRSRDINLNEFHTFLSARKKTEKSSSAVVAANKPLKKINDQLDILLEQSTVAASVKIDRLRYRQFDALAIHADVRMDRDIINLHDVRVQHAGGSIKMEAVLQQQSNRSDIAVKATIEQVDVARFFYEMENFGLKTLTDSNIRGVLSADADVALSVSDTGSILPHSMKGRISFNIQDGALLHFEPLEKVGKIIFRRRDLSNITFRDIRNTLDLQGSRIYINPMRIESSVLVMQVEGIYGLERGTDILIDVPLRNPKKDELILDDSIRAERSMKGIVLHLNAVDGEDGKVKIRLLSKRRSREKKADIE